jgi:hypothetical protein
MAGHGELAGKGRRGKGKRESGHRCGAPWGEGGLQEGAARGMGRGYRALFPARAASDYRVCSACTLA